MFSDNKEQTFDEISANDLWIHKYDLEQSSNEWKQCEEVKPRNTFSNGREILRYVVTWLF